MRNRIRSLCVGLVVPVVLSSSHLALAQQFGGFGGYGVPRIGYPGSRSGAFAGRSSYPGAAFGFDPRYLASRAFTAGGRAGSVTYGTPQPPAKPPCVGALADATTTMTYSPDDKILIGEKAFRGGQYWGAIENWNSALAAGPGNPVLLMLVGQAYFAAGSYREAALATRAAMYAVPHESWGVAIGGRNELYGDPKTYMFQLEQLESSVNAHPTDPAERFLLAFHYAYLGYPQPAVAQLDKVIELDPCDEMMAQFRAELLPRLPEPDAPMITPGAVSSARR